MKRSVDISLCFDTNCINARQNDPYLNQLDRWEEAGVIIIKTPYAAHQEMARYRRTSRASGRIFLMPSPTTPDEHALYRAIERVLFPSGAVTQAQRNDVEIVFTAIKWGEPLVTLDGGSSRQPGGILGNRDTLRELGARVMRPEEAVSRVRTLIEHRDLRIANCCEHSDVGPPEWLGQD